MVRTYINELFKNPEIVLVSFGIGGLIIGVGMGYAYMRNLTREKRVPVKVTNIEEPK